MHMCMQDASSAEDFASYQPRFSAECADLGVKISSSADKALSVCVDVARLEAVEHIPCMNATPAELQALSQVTIFFFVI